MATGTSYKLINQICKGLFQKEEARLQKWINTIALRNQEERDLSQPYGFLYGGEYFKPDWLGPGKWPKSALHMNLWGEMDNFLKSKTAIEEDKQFISQTLFAMVSPCESEQDLRDVLPECLTQVFVNLPGLERTRDPAYTIRMNERAYRQYLKVLPRIEFYTAAMLIY